MKKTKSEERRKHVALNRKIQNSCKPIKIE